MDNFLNWVMKAVPKDEVVVWFNMHNMSYEKIELFGDIFKSLYYIIIDTYLGDEGEETQITMSETDKFNHFQWCWNKLVEDFDRENISIKIDGDHKDYLQSFFQETFYSPKRKELKNSVLKFLDNVFDTDKPFAKSDLEILSEFYKILDKNISY
jgi:hypothetical protein